MAKSARLSGFPERLPAERVIEKRIIDIPDHPFALHLYVAVSIVTPMQSPISVIFFTPTKIAVD